MSRFCYIYVIHLMKFTRLDSVQLFLWPTNSEQSHLMWSCGTSYSVYECVHISLFFFFNMLFLCLSFILSPFRRRCRLHRRRRVFTRFKRQPFFHSNELHRAERCSRRQTTARIYQSITRSVSI